jgi:hypothetical protein
VQDEIPSGAVSGLVALRTWAAEHEVLDADLHDLAAEGLLPVARRDDQLYVDPDEAERVWAEHGDRMLAKRPTAPRLVRGRPRAALDGVPDTVGSIAEGHAPVDARGQIRSEGGGEAQEPLDGDGVVDAQSHELGHLLTRHSCSIPCRHEAVNKGCNNAEDRRTIRPWPDARRT